VWVARSSLHAWVDNPRKNDGEPVAKVAASIKRFGFASPIIARTNGEVIAGHTRLKAAEVLGLERVPVRYLDLDPAEAHLLALADNKLNEEAEWHSAAVASLLSDYSLDDAALAGWDSDDLEKLADELGALEPKEVVEDEVPEVPVVPVTKVGDLWLLGAHRVLCGDSTKAEDVARLMGGEKADAVLTDPPYGINQPGVPNDEPEKLAAIVRGAIGQLPVVNAVVVAFQSTRTFPAWLDGTREAGHKFERMLWLYKEAQCTFPWRGWILTSESILVSTVGDGQWQDAHPFSHDCYKLSEVSKELTEEVGWHGSVKPLRVVADILKRIAPTGARIYDPFLGSGTTLIAAEQLGRKCYGMEISPQYCDVIVKRWENLTGKTATLEAS
jgi:hypothetical protein